VAPKKSAVPPVTARSNCNGSGVGLVLPKSTTAVPCSWDPVSKTKTTSQEVHRDDLGRALNVSAPQLVVKCGAVLRLLEGLADEQPSPDGWDLVLPLHGRFVAGERLPRWAGRR
jgi:hypothetical protein